MGGQHERSQNRRDHRSRPGRPRRRRPCAGARLEPIVLEAGDACRPRHAAMGPRPTVLALGIQHRQGGGRDCWRRRAGILPNPTSTRPARKWSSAISNRSPAHTALKPHIRTSSRVTGISRVGFDKLKTRGREAAPFEIRYQNGQGPRSSRPTRSSTHPAPGIRRIRRAPMAFPPSARRRPRTGSPMACPTCWARTARAMPARPSPCWEPGIPRSAR